MNNFIQKKDTDNKAETDAVSNGEKKRKRIQSVLIIFTVLLFAAAGASAFHAYRKENRKKNLAYYDEMPSVSVIDDAGFNKDDVEHGFFDENGFVYPEDSDFKVAGDIDADAYQKYVKSWSENDIELLSDNSVSNYLICGVDSREGEEENPKCCLIIIASVNSETGRITLLPLSRNSWVYMSVPCNDKSYKSYYFKLNSAYTLGGPVLLTETAEKLYKIDIDGYVAIDIASVQPAINELGGLELDVDQKYADAIKEQFGTGNYPNGKNILDGRSVMKYLRLVYSNGDGDADLAVRQQKVCTSILKRLQEVSDGQMKNAARYVSDYVQTDLSKPEATVLLGKIMTQEWLKYEVVEADILSGNGQECVQTMIKSKTALAVDFPAYAQRIQTELYGETNIVDDESRPKITDFIKNEGAQKNEK